MSDQIIVPLGPSKAQLENLVISRVEVGVFRCVQGGENRCNDHDNPGPECWCDKCCTNGRLWESPLNADLVTWDPECGECGRKALLVEVIGVIDFTMLLTA
jgi:hypothetical protein